MKPFRSASVAIASALVLPAALHAGRARYGGTLRVETSAVVHNFDPASTVADAGEAAARSRILPLVYETLIAADAAGGLRPQLATSWESDGGYRRWRVHLRAGVKLHDGSELKPDRAATALRASEPGWKTTVEGDAVVIDVDRPRPDFPWELTDLRTAVAVRTAEGVVGSGPFRLMPTDPPRVELRAHEDYWGSRPFVDAVQIAGGRPIGDQMTSLALGRADFVSVRPSDFGQLASRGLRAASSRPLDVVALVFEPHRAGADAEAMRRVFSASIDRAALSSVLLQRQAEPAAAMLPPWLSGYAPMFREPPSRAAARTAATAIPVDRRRLTLRVDVGDPLGQPIAERVAVDARDVGFAVTVQAPAGLAPRPDVRLVRLPVYAAPPDRALALLVRALGPRITGLTAIGAQPPAGAPLDAVYRAERALLEHDVIVPLVHVQQVYGLSDRVESWSGPAVLSDGAWNLANLWLRATTPADPR